MYDKVKEWSQKTFPDGHTMTIVRLTFFGCRLLFATRNFVFGMNNVVVEYQISSSGLIRIINGLGLGYIMLTRLLFVSGLCWRMLTQFVH